MGLGSYRFSSNGSCCGLKLSPSGWGIGVMANVAAAALATMASSVSATTVTPQKYSVVQDSNWAGYVATAPTNTDTFTNIVGSWQIPSITGTTTATYSAFWVGLDGYGNSTVEQLGTAGYYTPPPAGSTSTTGTETYYAWYEMFPLPSIAIGMTVTPGDWMNASVQYEGANNYRLTMEDTTTNTIFTIDQTSNYGLRSSAEWVAESPGINGTLASLSNFGSATFLGASATMNGTDTGTISNFPNSALQLISGVGGLDATPSPLNANGNGFNVAIGSTAPAGTTLTASGNAGILAMTEFHTSPSSVPEPGMLPLMAVGGLLLLVRGRKMRH